METPQGERFFAPTEGTGVICRVEIQRVELNGIQMRSPWNANVSSNRLEVDLIVQGQGALIPIEIKLTATPLPHGATAMPWHEFPNWLNQQTG